MGKPHKESADEVEWTATAFDYYAEISRHEAGRVVGPVVDGDFHVVTKHPLGVVGIILPFNFPYVLFGWEAGAALGAGNAVILKPMPIRLSPTTTTFRVLPIARVKLGVSGSGDIASNSEQGPEGVERVERQSRARVSRYERNTTAHDRKNHASATALQLRRGPRQPATLPVKLSM